MTKFILLVSLVSFCTSFSIALNDQVESDTILGSASLRSRIIESLDDSFCTTNNCPPGDYNQFCNSCSYSKTTDTLTCKCLQNSGSYATTSMSRCVSYTTRGVPGPLYCSEYKACTSTACRPGSYSSSCYWCSETSSDFAGKISCKCKRPFTDLSLASQTEFSGPCNDLINYEGVLQCLDRCVGGTDKCRTGPYSSICVSCRESSPDFKGSLTCNCGKYYMWALYTGPCSALSIDYYSQLYCPTCPKGSCPYGDYTSSCVDCQYDSATKTLSCFCKSSETTWSDRVSITGPCSNIANKSGQLYCKSSCPSMNCMNGPYLTSCNNCSVFFGILKCSCPKNDGTFIESSLPPCAGSIVNVDGVLTCT